MKLYLISVARTLHAEIVVQAESADEALAAFERTKPEALESVEDLWNPTVWTADDDVRELAHLDGQDGNVRCFSVEALGLVDIGSVWDVNGGDRPAGMPVVAAEALTKPWAFVIQSDIGDEIDL